MKLLLTKSHETVWAYVEGLPSTREITTRNAGKSVVKGSSVSGKLNDYQSNQIKSLLGVECPKNENGYTYFNLSGFDKTGDAMEKAIKQANENKQMLGVLGVLTVYEGEKGPLLQIRVSDVHRVLDGATNISFGKKDDDLVCYIDAYPGKFDFTERNAGAAVVKSVPVSIKATDYDKKQIAYHLGVKANDVPASDKGYVTIRAEGWNKTGDILEKNILAARENDEHIGLLGLLTKYEGEKLNLQLNVRSIQRIFNNSDKPAKTATVKQETLDLPDDLPEVSDDDLPF